MKQKENESLLSQLFHSDAYDTPHDGSHTEGGDVETRRDFDADGKHGDDALENQGKGQQP